MRQTSYVYLLIAGSLVACNGRTDLIAPPTTDDLAVSIQWHQPKPVEPTPAVRISGGAGAVSVVVTRRDLCGTIVNARLNRSPNELAVVVRLSGNPAAICIAMETYLEYSGTITDVAPGSYRVRVFEGVGGRDPELIGSADVTVAEL